MGNLKDLKVDRGNPLMIGATVIGDSVNFAITAKAGSKCEVILYKKGEEQESFRIPFENAQVIGNVYAMIVKGIRPGRHYYAFRAGDRIFCDPYARIVLGREKFGDTSHLTHLLKAGFLADNFDWEGDRPLKKAFDEMIVYRLHVRGFTAHASSHVKSRGTFRGLIQKIPYLKELGITAMELMPVTEFEEVQSVMLRQSLLL